MAFKFWSLITQASFALGEPCLEFRTAGNISSHGTVLVAGWKPAVITHPSQPRKDMTALTSGLHGYLQNSTGMWGDDNENEVNGA